MGVFGGVTMPREVLSDREDTALFEPLTIGNSTASDELRAIAKATRTDDGISFGIDVYIHHGSEVECEFPSAGTDERLST